MAATLQLLLNMTNIEASQALQYFINEGLAHVDVVKWGNGYRSVALMHGKKYQLNNDGILNKRFHKNHFSI